MTLPKSLSPETSNVKNVSNVPPFFCNTAFQFPLISPLVADLDGLVGRASAACMVESPVVAGSSGLGESPGETLVDCGPGPPVAACDSEASCACRHFCQLQIPMPAAIRPR